MKDHRFAIAALTIGLAILALTPAFLVSHQQNVALLERLAPRIERARTLPPETKDAILKVVERVRQAPVDWRTDERRKIALERISHALEVKAAAHELTSVGQGSD
ncbi:MAG: hypothetical protein ACRECO_13425 [Xanthobacteraceae bacterium]